MDEIGNRVRELRKAGGLTQKQLAEAAGLSEITIKTLEGGKYTPRGDTLDKLARALQVSVSVLLGEGDIFDGPWPDATIQAMGLSEEFLAKYRRLWPLAARADRIWMLGFFRLVADAERRVQALEALADEPDGAAPSAANRMTIAGHVVAY